MAIASQVAFKDRALDLGIANEDIDALVAADITSYVVFAYCRDFQPGQSDNSTWTAFLTTALGAAPSAAEASKFRRLFFEAHALSLDLKPRADRNETSEAQVIPLAEKMDRIRQQHRRLAGISFTPQSEPSHSLVDKVCQQLDDNVGSYVDLQKSTSRQDETLHAKANTSLSWDGSGGLKLSKRQKLEGPNVTGEHRLRQAFLRGSSAYDLSGMAIFTTLDLWTQNPFEKMNEQPLANYRSIPMEQVINADKALWVRLSNETRGKLQPKTGEAKAFDTAFTRLCEHPEVLQHLAPLQNPTSSRPEQPLSSFQAPRGKGSYQTDEKGKQGKGKCRTPGPGIQVPDNCEIFVDGKQLCKRWQIGRCTAKVKPEKRKKYGGLSRMLEGGLP